MTNNLNPTLLPMAPISLNGWWALWAQGRRRKRAAALAGPSLPAPVAVWELDSIPFLDSSGRGNNLTNNNGVTATPGKFGNAALLTMAQQNFLSAAYNADMNCGGTQDWTVCGWASLATLAVATAIWSQYDMTAASVVQFYYDPGGGGCGLYITSNTLAYQYWNGMGGARTANVPFFWAVTRSGTTYLVRINGNSTSNTGFAVLNGGTCQFYLGTNGGCWAGMWLDRVRKFNVALTDAQLTQLMNEVV